MRRILCGLVLAAALLPLPRALADATAQQLRDLQTHAMAAYKSGDFAQCAKDFAAALTLRPHHPRLLYNLAACSAKAGRAQDAIANLDAYAAMGLIAEVEKDDDFATLKDDPGFKAVLARFKTNGAPIGTSTIVATIPEPFLAEGIAYDPAGKRFFVSSVDQRKIVQIAQNGTVTDFVTKARDGLLGAFGMAIDAKRQLLWVATTAVAHTRDLPPEDRLNRGVFAFSLSDGHLVHRVVSASKIESVIGDAIVGPDGIYATDSALPEIVTIPSPHPDIAGPKLWLKSDAFASLQGMTTTPDEKAFIVADYAKGLHLIDRATKSIGTVAFAGGTTLLGIDGLYRTGNTLLAVQNGINPQRVIALTLGADGRSIARVKVLSANDKKIPEPSLGTVANDEFCVVANAQWSRFNDDGKPTKALDPPHIACVAIPK